MSGGIDIDTRAADKMLKRAGVLLSNPTKPFQVVDRAVKSRRIRDWNRVKAGTGGVVAGQKWAPMKDQYKRKDGTINPPWGGIPMLDRHFAWSIEGRGKTLGKKRPSGQRVKKSSIIGKDTGLLAAQTLSIPPDIRKKGTTWSLEIGKKALETVIYAGTIFGHDNRNPLRWEIPKDRILLKNEFRRWMIAAIRKARR